MEALDLNLILLIRFWQYSIIPNLPLHSINYLSNSVIKQPWIEWIILNSLLN